jgi:hypothetical protein
MGWRRVAGLLILLFGVVVLWGFRLGAPNGLTRTSYSNDRGSAPIPGGKVTADGKPILYELEYWPWAYFDSVCFGFMDAKLCDTIELHGRVWQGAPGRARWRLEHAGGVEVLVDDKRVLHQPELVPRKGGLRTDTFEVDWARSYLDLRVVVAVTTRRANAISGYRVVLEEELKGGGWRRLQGHRLYPATDSEPPTQATARRDARRAFAYRWAGRGLVALLALLALDRLLAAARRRPALFAVSATAFAASMWVRAAVLMERAAAEPSLWALARQTDNYLMFARAELAGTESALFFSPGATWWLVVLTELLGPDLAPLFGALSVVAALGVGALAWGTGRLFGLGAGALAGLFGAFYGPLVFYQATLQAVSPLTSVLSWVPLALAVSSECPRRRCAFGAGCIVSAAALIRPTALVLVPAFLIVLLLGRPIGDLVRSRLSRTLGFAAGMLLILLPQFGLNRARSHSAFISANGPMNMLIGINRDSDGTYGVTDAFREANEWYVRNEKSRLEQIAREIADDPGRALALQARKFGLLAAQSEASNVVNYERKGLGASSLIRRLSADGRLGMPLVVWWGLAGALMALGVRARRTGPGGMALAIGALLYAGATAAFIVEGRIRAPLVPLLMPFAGLGVWTVMSSFRDWRRWLVSVAGAGAAVLALLWCARELPRKSYLSELPQGAAAVDMDLKGGLRLVGWKLGSSELTPGGYAYIHLYWRYGGDGADPQAQVDIVAPGTEKPIRSRRLKVGDRTYPAERPSAWPADAILDEGYFFSIPRSVKDSIEVHVGSVGPGEQGAVSARPVLTLDLGKRAPSSR